VTSSFFFLDSSFLRFVYDKIFHDPHKTPPLGLNTMFGVYKDCGQCCQGAEISAAKLKKGRNKFGGAGKVRGRTFTQFIKKGPKRGLTFFGFGFS
jgi:hypothetical protein